MKATLKGSHVFVHKYKHSHENRRKKYKKLLKKGEVTIHRKAKDGWWYEHVQGQ